MVTVKQADSIIREFFEKYFPNMYKPGSGTSPAGVSYCAEFYHKGFCHNVNLTVLFDDGVLMVDFDTGKVKNEARQELEEELPGFNQRHVPFRAELVRHTKSGLHLHFVAKIKGFTSNISGFTSNDLLGQMILQLVASTNNKDFARDVFGLVFWAVEEG